MAANLTPMYLKAERAFRQAESLADQLECLQRMLRELPKHKGQLGIGVISDYEDQPLLIGSHLGSYAIVTVGVIRNIEELASKAFRERTVHFAELARGEVNPTELVATLINQEATFEDGIRAAQEAMLDRAERLHRGFSGCGPHGGGKPSAPEFRHTQGGGNGQRA